MNKGDLIFDGKLLVQIVDGYFYGNTFYVLCEKLAKDFHLVLIPLPKLMQDISSSGAEVLSLSTPKDAITFTELPDISSQSTPVGYIQLSLSDRIEDVEIVNNIF